MINNRKIKRPRFLLRKVLSGLFNDTVREIALGEFDERYNDIYNSRGRIAADMWYLFNIVMITPSLLVDKTYWSCAMIKNYIKVAWRAMVKHKGFSFINISGLATGLACFTLISLWVSDELSYDRFHKNIDRIYRVVQNIHFSDHSTTWAISQGPLAPSLEKDYPEIEKAARYSFSNTRIKYGDREFQDFGGYTDQEFLQIFSCPVIIGDKSTVLKDPNTVILSEELAAKIFGDENPIGKNVIFNRQYDMTVTGVFKNPPLNSTLRFNYLVPFVFTKTYGYTVEQWGNSSCMTIVMLKDGVSREEAVSKIARHLDDKPTLEKDASLDLQPFGDIHLKSNLEFDIGGRGDIRYVYLFSIIAVFILLIACINFMNLSTARSANRAKEVGMRKVAGARKTDVIIQFFGESIVMAVIAMIAAAIIAALLIAPFNELSGKQLTFNPFSNIFTGLGLLLITLIAGLISGSYPALYLSAFEPAKVLKGAIASGARGGTFRKILVIAQFSITIALITSTAVVYYQLDFMKNRKLGFKKENILCVSMQGGVRENSEEVIEELKRHPHIVNVTAASRQPTWGYSFSNSLWEWEGKDPDQETLMRAVYVDYDYFETFEMEMASGRTYSRKYAADSTEALIINEAAAKAMGMTDPVGKWLGRDEYRATIIGVVKDYNFRSLHTKIDPLILILNRNYSGTLFVSVSTDDIPSTISFIENIWKKFKPERDFNFTFLDNNLDRMYRAEQRTGTLFTYFSTLAILISCLGLFGLASFTAEQRTREIGIRKVLGASSGGIVLLLTREFTKWVMIANLIAWPAAYIGMNMWLENFAYRIDIGISVLALSGILAFVISLATVSWQALITARTNPAYSLKHE